jgi:NADPH:quinone reductase-like Zn-dependent oxidoreductase
VSLYQTYLRHLNLKGLYLGTQEEFVQLLELVASGTVTPYIDTVLNLEDAAEAHHRLESGEFFGKIVWRG